MNATIPMPGDVAALIGTWAEHVENRSLLLDKFVFHKKWGLGELKANDAHRWTLLRIADGGDGVITREANSRQEESRRLQQRNPEKSERLADEAELAKRLASTAKPPADLAQLRSRHTRRFIGLFRSAYGSRAAVTIGQLEGRLAINLADSLIQNAGICLDRLLGLPFIPGSAVKGVCRAAALEEVKAAGDANKVKLLGTFCTVFGTAENDYTHGDLRSFRRMLPDAGDRKGAVSFLPAYPVNEAKVVVDLTNVHYPDYYRSGRTENLSNEKPQPNPFPAIETGAQFAFCLVLNGMNAEPELLSAASRWLQSALTVRGLGAKTAAGYGWFSIQPAVLEEIEAEERREAESAAAKVEAARQAESERLRESERLATLSPEALAAEKLLQLADESFATFAKDIATKPEAEQRAFISLLASNKDKRERWKTWKKKKPDLASGITAVGISLHLPPLP